MDENLLTVLSEACANNSVYLLIQDLGLTSATVEALKKQSARFYFSNPTEAVRLANLAYELGSLLPDPAPALGQWALANALMFEDRFHEAVDLYSQAYDNYLELGMPLDAARLGVGYVWALAYSGRFGDALTLATKIEPSLATSAATVSDDHRRLGGLLNNVGILFDLLGRYEEALAAYDRKLAIAQDLGNQLDIARAQHNRACTLTLLNAYDEALMAFQKAEHGFSESKATADLVRLAFCRGVLFARQGQYKNAECEFLDADQYSRGLQVAEQAHATLVVYRALSQLKRDTPVDRILLDDLATAQMTLETHGPLFEEGLAWLAIGKYNKLIGNNLSAKCAFRRVLKIVEHGGEQALVWEALHELGLLAETEGASADAIAFYEQAISQIESVRRDLHIGAFRAAYLTDKLVVYEDLAMLHTKLGKSREAFMTVERARSRLLAEKLAVRLHNEVMYLTNSTSPDVCVLAQRLQRVLKRLEGMYDQIALDDTTSRGEPWLSVGTVPLAEVQELEEEAVHLTRQIESVHPSFSPLIAGQIAPLQEVQRHLGDSLFLYYHLAAGRVWAFVIDRTGILAHCDLASLVETEKFTRGFEASVDRTLGLAVRYGNEVLKRYLPNLVADAKAKLAGLYDCLFRPLKSFISSGKPIVVSPDGFLNYVPYHALFDGKNYLIEHYPVSYATSATVLNLCARRISKGRGMLIAGYGGDRLNQVTSEVESLAEMFPKALFLREAQATSSRLLIEGPKYRFLHLAAHARFRFDNVSLSSLSLSDRRLTLAEISRLELDADLVALSGCETGRGRLRGADVLSLAGGFLGAGARSLLVSLWRVDDATTVNLMKSFYVALQNGMSRSTAIQRAQQELLDLGQQQSTDYSFYCHPAYWAPFFLIGEWGTLENLPSDWAP